jgi:hypothetical protein
MDRPVAAVHEQQFAVSIDEDAVQQWRRKSEQGHAGAHCIEAPLRVGKGQVAKASSHFPTALRSKMHDEYVESYLTQKIGVQASAYNARLARNSWPIRLQDTEITATFRARGNQDDKLFMTPSTAALTLPNKQLIKGDDVLRVNLVGRASFDGVQRHDDGLPPVPGVDEEEPAGGKKISSFGEFKQRFVFPFSLRSKFDTLNENHMKALREEYNTDRDGRRKMHGHAPGEGRATRTSTRQSGGTGTPRSRGQSVASGLDMPELGGLPWNPFINEDLGIVEEGRRRLAVSFQHVRNVQELFVGILPIKDLRGRLGTYELQQLVEEVRAITTTRLVTRIAHFLCHKLMQTDDTPGGRPPRSRRSSVAGSQSGGGGLSARQPSRDSLGSGRGRQVRPPATCLSAHPLPRGPRDI